MVGRMALLDAPQAWLWPELSRATCVSAANSSSSSCRAQRGRQSCSQASAVWLLLPSHHSWHLLPGVGTALTQQGLEHIWLWHCRKGRCQFSSFLLFILLKKLLCAGLARGLGIQKISENTCCPGNINPLAWGILQEAQKKPGSRQAEKKLFG